MRAAARGAIRFFFRHDGLFLAAGLSFYVVICILPLFMLLVAVGGFLLSNELVVQRVLHQLAGILPVYQSEMERILSGVVAARGVSGLVGTGILLLFASQLFAATRLVLNRIFGVTGRGFLHGMLFDLGMIVLVGSLFFLTLAITAGLGWAKRSFNLFDNGVIEALFFEWVGLILALATNTLLFIVLYRFVPVRRIPWASVVRGSLATAVLWELAKELFRWYIEGIGVYSAVYGSFGVTIAVIMWIYYSAIVFVLGAALIRALEERRRGPVGI